MDQNIERMSLGRFYMNGFANAIKKFTTSKWMVAIVNGFISVMPVIIAASIITLLTALPEMFMQVLYQSEWKNHLPNKQAFENFQAWGGVISGWSMGVLGLFVTASIAKNLATELNTKLPLARRINENIVFYAAISTYLMLSVIEFTATDALHPSGAKAIFVDGLAAQGILPGIIIGLTLPYVFYFSYKNNWTIRLPKQVPQTISQAFLGVIPLLLALVIFGSVAWTTNYLLDKPLLFFIFEKIQTALTNNPNINDSYGLIVLYTFMESGFWFIGVHPEPVHALMRASFWLNNLDINATAATAADSHIFTEPLMYGFGAMGGSGTTLMVPFICLMFARSTQLKVVGKTGSLPIIFQVNEPTLFGVPLILNPIFALPMIFTGMINDVLFKALADATAFKAGSLNLPWSTPFFLQASLGTPTQWQPWLFSVIALIVATSTYLPFVLIQDRIYLKEEANKLNNVNLRSTSGFDIIVRKWFSFDPISKKAQSNFILKEKLALKKALANCKDPIEAKKLKAEFKQKVILNKAEIINLEFENLIEFAQDQYEKQLKRLEVKKNKQIVAYNEAIQKKQALHDAKIERKVNYIKNIEEKINNFNNIMINDIDSYHKAMQYVSDEKRKYIIKLNQAALAVLVGKVKAKAKKATNGYKKEALAYKLKLLENTKNILVKKWAIKFSLMRQVALYKKTLVLRNKLKDAQAKNKLIAVKYKFNPESVYQIFANEKEYAKKLALIKYLNKYTHKRNKLADFINKKYEIKKLPAENLSKLVKETDLSTIKKVFIANKTKIYAANAKELAENKRKLAKGVNPWKVSQVEPKQRTETNKVVAKGIDINRQYNVLVLCLGAGSSAVLANKIHEGLVSKGYKNINVSALAWGQHESALNSTDALILSPQLGAQKQNLEGHQKEFGFALHACRGKDYIELSKDESKAAELALELLKGRK